MEPIPICDCIAKIMADMKVVPDEPAKQMPGTRTHRAVCPLIEAVNKKYSPKTIRPATVKNSNIRTKKGIWK